MVKCSVSPMYGIRRFSGFLVVTWDGLPGSNMVSNACEWICFDDMTLHDAWYGPELSPIRGSVNGKIPLLYC